MKYTTALLSLLLLCAETVHPACQKEAEQRDYLTPVQVNSELQQLAKSDGRRVKLHLLAKSAGGYDNYLVEIGQGTGTNKPATVPGVIVVANLEGSYPHATLAAMHLIRDLAANPSKSDSLTWYVVPCANPDAAMRYFTRPRYADSRNLRPFNDDMDEAVDEDGFEDLNGDGWITRMRFRDPDGTLIPDSADARLLRRADPSKGEKGLYKLYTEGIDNDNDGAYNEDGTGGTNLAVHFPHLFPHDQSDSGIFPGYEPEVHALMKFITGHPDIALSMTYGSTNFCLSPPRTNRKSQTSLTAIRLPQRYARMLNADPEKTYSLEEVKEMMKAIVPPGTTVDDNMVATMLDQGPVVNPLADDLKIYKQFSDQYKIFLKDAGLTGKRSEPAPDRDGSYELWAYYHLGLPSFSQDFWGFPEFEPKTPPNSNKPASGTEKAPADRGAPKTSHDQLFMIYSDSILGGGGFIPWTPFTHPQLGEVEIGGEVPFARTVPPVAVADSLVRIQVPWIYSLARQIPDLKIHAHKVEPLGSGVFRITAWIRNGSVFPFPIAMGKRNQVPVPAQLRLTASGVEFLTGRELQPVTGIDAHSQLKVEWLIRLPESTDIQLEIKAPNAYGDVKTLKAGGK